jgi:hypothetical protein
VGMYSRAMDEMMSKLIRKTRPSGLEVRAGPGHFGEMSDDCFLTLLLAGQWVDVGG